MKSHQATLFSTSPDPPSRMRGGGGVPLSALLTGSERPAPVPIRRSKYALVWGTSALRTTNYLICLPPTTPEYVRFSQKTAPNDQRSRDWAHFMYGARYYNSNPTNVP